MPSLSELIAQHKAATAGTQVSASAATPIARSQKETPNEAVKSNPVTQGKMSFSLGKIQSNQSDQVQKEEKTEVNPSGSSVSVAGVVIAPTASPVVVLPMAAPATVSLASQPAVSAAPAFDVTNILMTGVDAISANNLDAFLNTLQIIRQAYQDFGNISDMNLVIHAMKNILLEVKQHPEFVKLLLPEDIGMLVRILRESYGIAVVQKVERSGKRKANKEDERAFEEMMAGLGEIKL